MAPLKTVHLTDLAGTWALCRAIGSITMVSTFRKWNFLVVECIHCIGLLLGSEERGISWKNA